MKPLVDRIYRFVDKYARIRHGWDPLYDDEDDKFTSTDAWLMKMCAYMISKGLTPERCLSEWNRRGYKPYSSIEGRKEHDYLVKEICKIKFIN